MDLRHTRTNVPYRVWHGWDENQHLFDEKDVMEKSGMLSSGEWRDLDPGGGV